MSEGIGDALGYRRLLFGIAYRMLGTVAEAEDAVQETYLRWHRNASGEVRSPKAWLTATVTRLCIDQLRQAKARRQFYVGPWLPEPIAGPEPADPADHAALADDLSLALLIVLERLSPPERAAFVLHEAFDQGYDEIAAVLGKSEAACRQLVHRARERVRQERPRFAVSRTSKQRLATQFFAAVRSGDLASLTQLLTTDAVLLSDGGGKARSALNPIRGALKIARFLTGVRRKQTGGLQVAAGTVNGEPALIGRAGGRTDFVLALAFDKDRISAVHLIRNPDKLHHLQH